MATIPGVNRLRQQTQTRQSAQVAQEAGTDGG